MSTPFIEMPQRAAASPCTTSSPPWAVAPADWLTLPSTTTDPDIMFSAIPVLGVAADTHRRMLVHPGAVVPDVPVDLDVELRVETAGDGVGPARVDDPPAPRPRAGARDVVEALVELAQGRHREVDDLRLECRRHQASAFSHT